MKQLVKHSRHGDRVIPLDMTAQVDDLGLCLVGSTAEKLATIEDEYIKLKNKELCERMPYLIPRNVWTNEIIEDYDYSWTLADSGLPDGWIPLFLQMCEDIRQPLIDANYLDKFRFSQIKEKYNTMRCYNFGAPETVQNIIDKYEHISRYVCQKCGKPATKETLGWIASYCDKCYESCPDRCEKIKFKPVFVRTSYNGTTESKVKIDCSAEWRRLYERKM